MIKLGLFNFFVLYILNIFLVSAKLGLTQNHKWCITKPNHAIPSLQKSIFRGFWPILWKKSKKPNLFDFMENIPWMYTYGGLYFSGPDAGQISWS